MRSCREPFDAFLFLGSHLLSNGLPCKGWVSSAPYRLKIPNCKEQKYSQS